MNLHKSELLEEISNQLSMGADNLMEDDRYLLEAYSQTLEGENAHSAVPTATLLRFCLWRMKTPILVKLVGG